VKNLFGNIVPRPPSPAPIALLTDFGTADSYVGAMKAVIASIHAPAPIIDICHTTGAQDIREAAYHLWSCYRFFPQETVFVVVVDPGVGTKRNIILLRMASRWFLAPDNGVLDLVIGDETVESSTSIRTENTRYVLSPVSNTFHGRDIFAPIAAYVSLGVKPRELGDSIDPPQAVRKFVTRKPSRSASVLHIDHFGNIITDIRPEEGHRPSAVKIRGKTVRHWLRNYHEAPEKTVCLILGSSGLVELVRKNGSAAASLKTSPGEPIGVTWT
jgi:S-adenosylmethionine hydrolase